MTALSRLGFSAVLLLAACAPPDGKRMDGMPEPAPAEAAVVMAEPVAEAPARAEDLAPLCSDAGDGIGGTGCPVD